MDVPCMFKIVKPRVTKLGDYRYDFRSGQHTITINNDLKGDGFLFTALHEIAHQHTMIKYGRSVNPHGEEWKQAYKKLLLVALKNDAFENPVLILDSLNQIKSSSVYNAELFKKIYSNPNIDEVFLGDVEEGSLFLFNKVVYRKIGTNRTRTRCLSIKNKKEYVISNIASVVVVENY